MVNCPAAKHPISVKLTNKEYFLIFIIQTKFHCLLREKIFDTLMHVTVLFSLTIRRKFLAADAEVAFSSGSIA